MSEIKRALKEEFILLPIDQVPHKKVPKYPELTVKNAYAIFADDAETLKHLPLLHENKRLPDRDFVFDVL